MRAGGSGGRGRRRSGRRAAGRRQLRHAAMIAVAAGQAAGVTEGDQGDSEDAGHPRGSERVRAGRAVRRRRALSAGAGRGPGRRGGLRAGHLRPAPGQVANRRWPARPRPPATDLAARPPRPAGGPLLPRRSPAPRSSTPITSGAYPRACRRSRPASSAAGTAVTDHGLLGRTWGGLVHGLFDRFLTVSQFSARCSAPPARTQVIYGGADTRRFAPRPAPTGTASCSSGG